MNMEFRGSHPDAPPPRETWHGAANEEDSSLQDEAIQEAYRKACLEQLRHQTCLGCGETEFF